ncbi:hypothetical protein NEOLEDRAFT_1183813, partial [Neolentinus lepideus HHB14362 ss-1]
QANSRNTRNPEEYVPVPESPISNLQPISDRQPSSPLSPVPSVYNTPTVELDQLPLRPNSAPEFCQYRPTTPTPPTPPFYTVAEATPTPLPSRRDKAAPVFDPEQPRTLVRYFENLDDLFASHKVTTDEAKKAAALKYVPMAVEDLWKTLPEYSVEHTYVAFVAAVKTLYLAVSEDRRYTRGFNAELWLRIVHRLQIKDIDHPPDTAYDVQKVYEAAAFALYGTATTGTSGSQSTSIVSDAAPTASSVKSEELAALVGVITKSIGQVLGPALTALTQNAPAAGAAPVAYRPPRTDTCHYCGKLNCSIGRCPSVEEDIRLGLCRRNQEGKVVLPAGAMVPRYIIGATMRERIQEWHRQNPNQRAAGILSVQDGMLFEIEHQPSADRAAYILNADEHIEYLYREIQALDGARKRPIFDGVHIPPRPRHADVENRSQGSQPPGLPEVGEQQPSATTSEPAVNRSSPSSATSTLRDPPPHPFNRAKDIVRPRQAAPKTIRPDPVPEAEAEKREPAYKTQAPVYNPQLTEDVFKRSLTSTCVSLSPEELLAISPDVRSKYREIVTPKKVPTPNR